MNYFKTSLLLAAMTALFLGVGWLLGGVAGAMIAFVIALGTNAYAWWNSDKMALRMHNAREVDRASAPELYAMVEELARRADLPMPRVYVIEDAQPNAFATGRGPESAAVAATTGIMRTLSREELAGVMAHELAHVRNPLGIVGVILAAILAPIAAALIQMMISRTREYAADRAGGEICGNPLWLAAALEKISGRAQANEMASAERHPETAHMFIVNPLAGKGHDNLFSTHPDPANRIAALRALAREMEGGGGAALETAGAPAGGGRERVERPSRIPTTRGRNPWR